ncbi:CbrC family protein [Xanthomonas sacchari]|uniref:CbrC family protein n=1 Tax=Xanthomonas sacchari TaxID=56458 RepID=UPI003B20E0E2
MLRAVRRRLRLLRPNPRWRYQGPFYCAGDAPQSLCPWCIADGRVAARWLPVPLPEVRPASPACARGLIQVADLIGFVRCGGVPAQRWERLACR